MLGKKSSIVRKCLYSDGKISNHLEKSSFNALGAYIVILMELFFLKVDLQDLYTLHIQFFIIFQGDV